ncbi:Hypothetical protein A7982_07410 [Minicystis rosea]|nr:Hypothetical protein A7982_07410 [Minicystis rosea]
MRSLAPPRARRVTGEHFTIVAGTAAMTAFVLSGAATAAGLIFAPLGMLGSVGAAAIFLVVLAYAHTEGGR